jgi:hypothetical protein
MATNQVPRFGVPEFAKEINAAYPHFFEVLPRVSAALNDLTSRACEKPEPVHRVILNLGLLAGISMVELVTLAGNGLGQGAMKITRTLMETAVNAEYLRQNPKELDAYLGWSWVEQKKDLDFVKANLPHLIPIITQAVVDGVDKQFLAVRSLFEKPDKSLRASWCSLNLADRAAKVGLADVYRMVNSLSSAFIHATSGGLAKHFNTDEDIDRIAIPPSLKYCAHALVAGHQLLCFMVETLAKTFGREPVHSIASLSADFQHAWPAAPDAAPPAAPAAPAAAPTT